MKEIQIGSREEGQRLNRFLNKYLPNAGSGFLYKMLRKKNITLNDRKAAGNEVLRSGDRIRLWFSEETLEHFQGKKPAGGSPVSEGKAETMPSSAWGGAFRKASKEDPLSGCRIIYEDEQVLLFSKPAGLLSQKSRPGDDCAIDAVIRYLLQSGQIDPAGLEVFRPGICSRLDRNTSGLMAAGKTVAALQELNQMFAGHEIGKYYLCAVLGKVEGSALLSGYLSKDESRNQVQVREEPWPGALPVRTWYEPLAYADDSGQAVTLLKVRLLTGKSHQIRAHLAWAGYPIISDPKYLPDAARRAFPDVHRQLLHCHRLEMPHLQGVLSGISDRVFESEMPEDFSFVSWQYPDPDQGNTE